MKTGPKLLLKRLALILGYDVHRLHANDAFTAQRSLLANRQVDVILDVGAFVGEIATRYHELFPTAKIHCLEPFEPSYVELRRRVGNFAEVHNLGVADASGERQFFVNGSPYTNSLLTVDTGSNSYVDSSQTVSKGSVTVKVVDLDRFCKSNGIRHVSILKLDIQGAELHALRGATTILGEKLIDLIYLEVNFAPLYEGQAAFCDIQEFLERFGYHLAGLFEPAVTTRGFMAWSNAIFVGPEIATGAEWQWR